MAFLFRRLGANKSHVLAFNILLGVIGLIGVASVFFVALRCNLSRPWDFINGQCTGVPARWKAFAAFDIATEVCVAIAPIFILYGLQMPMDKKFAITIAFMFRTLYVLCPRSNYKLVD